MNDPEIQGASLEQVNKSLFERFYKRVLAESVGEEDRPVKSVSYTNDSGGRFVVTLISSEDEAEWGGSFSRSVLPDDFKLPLVQVFDDEEMRTSIYGPLPEAVVGADGELYFISNYYIFNSEGKAMKVEDIYKNPDEGTLEEKLDNWGLKIEDTKKLDFSPREVEMVVLLEGSDYEKLGWILSQIESGHLYPAKFDAI